MPAKRKKKKVAKKQETWEFEYFFDDATMSETDGAFDLVKELMDEDMGEWVGGVVKTRMSMFSQFGECAFKLDFYPDRRVIIVGYAPSVGDVYYNPDVRCLSRWCQANGWNVPEPSSRVISESPAFWKYMWKTNLVDSGAFDLKYGVRPSMVVPTASEDEEDGEEV
jgi:hypothetical protein